MEKGIEIQSITCDGRRGLLHAYPHIPTQMCQYHQLGRAIFYLTRKPKSEAGKALLAISYELKTHTYDSLKIALKEWLEIYHTYFNERSEVNPKYFKHRKLRSAFRSIERHLPYLFTYKKYPSLNIPRTTNRLASFFKLMKSKLVPHAGLSDKNKFMFLKDFINQRT